jgi:5-methylcytosine-specific restriction endonuclease McrA
MKKRPKLLTSKPRITVAASPKRLSVATTKSRRTTGRALQAERRALWLERGQCCAACGRFVEFPGGFELDHITPLALGGSDAPENKQLLCAWIDHEGTKQGCHVDKTRSDGSHG